MFGGVAPSGFSLGSSSGDGRLDFDGGDSGILQVTRFSPSHTGSSTASLSCCLM